MNINSSAARRRVRVKRCVRVGILFVASISVAACASFNGQQPYSQNDKALLETYKDYITGDVITKFYSTDATSRKNLTQEYWRNDVIGARMAIADARYAEFVAALTGQRNSFNLATGITALGLSSGASIAAKSAANALSAGAAAVTGASNAINTTLYAQETVQILVTQMDANRTSVKAKLLSGEQLTAEKYTIDQALSDLSDYEFAGALQRALGSAAQSANQAKTSADNQVASVTGQQLSGNTSAPVANPTQAAIPFGAQSVPISLNISGAYNSVAVLSQALKGKATASGTTITYTPSAGFSGADTFQYTASNANGTSGSASVTLIVGPPPPPVANAVSQQVTEPDPAHPVPVQIDLDVSGVNVTQVAVSSQPSNGQAKVTGGTTITYTPNAGFKGTDRFKYTATNASGTSPPAEADITIVVPPPAPAPPPAPTTSPQAPAPIVH